MLKAHYTFSESKPFHNVSVLPTGLYHVARFSQRDLTKENSIGGLMRTQALGVALFQILLRDLHAMKCCVNREAQPLQGPS